MAHEYGVIIVGAGAAGLMAARQLAQKGLNILVVEAGEHAGGRINTLYGKGFSQPAEAGAEFVHGDLPFTMQLLREAGIAYTASEGDILEYRDGRVEQQENFIEDQDELQKPLKDLTADMPVAVFLNKHFSGEQHARLRRSALRFVEGYEAADAERASTLAMCADLVEEDAEQYRIEGGYSKMITYLETQCRDYGCTFRYSEPAAEIHWQEGKATVKTTTGSYHTKKVLVTVPLATLQREPGQAETIKFVPSIGQKLMAAKTMGAGLVIKLLLEFTRPFWQENKKMKNAGFIFSDEEIPTWWTQLPAKTTLLTGWVAGPKAGAMKELSDDKLLTKALGSLAAISGMPVETLQQQLKAWHVANWQQQPYIRCAYTYATVGGQEAIAELNRPENGTLFFAGEATYTGSATGTVEAALASAVNVVKEILNS